MPSLTNLQLLLAILLPLGALSNPVADDGLTSADQPEISGEGLQDVIAFQHHNWVKLTETLYTDIKMLLDEQFERDFGEPPKNMTYYSSVRIPTLLLKPSDGCLSRKFNKQTCLRRLYDGLTTYSEYMIYVERENLTSVQLFDVKQQISNLLNIIKDKVHDAEIQTKSISALPDGSAWTQRTVTHSVLYNFSEFLKDMHRALKFINSARSKNNKETKESERPSEKHPQQ